MEKQYRCYNCGCDLSKKSSSTKEHLPPKMLTKYLKSPPQNNVTINSCKPCNNDKSTLDEKYMYGILMTLDPDKLKLDDLSKIMLKNNKIKQIHLSDSRTYPLCEKQIDFFTDIVKGIYYFDNSGKEPLSDICDCNTPDVYQAKPVENNETITLSDFKEVHAGILTYQIINTPKQVRFMFIFCERLFVCLAFRKKDKA